MKELCGVWMVSIVRQHRTKKKARNTQKVLRAIRHALARELRIRLTRCCQRLNGDRHDHLCDQPHAPQRY